MAVMKRPGSRKAGEASRGDELDVERGDAEAATPCAAMYEGVKTIVFMSGAVSDTA